MWEDFKKFAIRGNVIDMAVGVVIGAAFGNIVKSLVDDVIMPPIGLITGGIDLSQHYIVLKGPTTPGDYATQEEMMKAGAVLLRYGVVLNTIVSFAIVAFAVFLLIQGVEKLHRKHAAAPASTKDCPECAMAIPLKAVRCGHCTAKLSGRPEPEDKRFDPAKAPRAPSLPQSAARDRPSADGRAAS